MGTRSKGGYKDPRNAVMKTQTRSKERAPKLLFISKYRLRTRKYRKIK